VILAITFEIVFSLLTVLMEFKWNAHVAQLEQQHQTEYFNLSNQYLETLKQSFPRSYQIIWEAISHSNILNQTKFFAELRATYGFAPAPAVTSGFETNSSQCPSSQFPPESEMTMTAPTPSRTGMAIQVSSIPLSTSTSPIQSPSNGVLSSPRANEARILQVTSVPIPKPQSLSSKEPKFQF
jgi:hypothetical protein